MSKSTSTKLGFQVRGIIRRLESRILSWADELYSSGYSRDKINAIIAGRLAKLDIAGKMGSRFYEEALKDLKKIDSDLKKHLDKLSENVNLFDSEEAIKTRDKVFGDFSKIAGNLEKGITNELNKAIRGGLSKEQLAHNLQRQIGIGRRGAYAVANTGLQAHSSAINMNAAARVGATKFKYTGPPADRDFCRNILGKEFTTEQIENMNNGQGLDVRIYRGGWNCSHRWTATEFED